MRPRDIDVLQPFVRALVPFLREQLLERDARIAVLEQRLRELETHEPWAGVWDPEKAYAPRVFCTIGGGLWYTRDGAAAGARPGGPAAESRAWQLCCKAGRRE
jgi:hypothetical protein